MSMRPAATLLVLVVLTAALGACGEKDKLGQVTTYKQGMYQGKPDTHPWEGGPSVYSNGSSWTAGDRISWELALKNRQQSQNEYQRVN